VDSQTVYFNICWLIDKISGYDTENRKHEKIHHSLLTTHHSILYLWSL